MPKIRMVVIEGDLSIEDAAKLAHAMRLDGDIVLPPGVTGQAATLRTPEQKQEPLPHAQLPHVTTAAEGGSLTVKPAPEQTPPAVAPPVSTPVAAPPPAPAPAPVVTSETPGAIPQEVAGATTIRALVTAIRDVVGCKTKDSIIAWCKANKPSVRALEKMPDIDDRIGRACVAIGIN